MSQKFSTSNLTGLVCALAVLVFAGCKKEGGGAGGPPADFAMEVELENPAVTNVENTLTAVGTVEANERVELRPKTAGLIEKILFTEGDRVKKGTVLFELDRKKEQASVAQATAEQKIAEANRRRAKTLEGSKAISQQELEQLESIESVKAAYTAVGAETLAERQITAPFDGVIGPRLISAGQYVPAGATLATMVDDSQMKVAFRIPERYLATLKEGQPGRLKVSAFSDRVFDGKVDLINPEADELTRTIQVRLIVPNKDQVLKPGLFARIELITTNRPNAIIIPEGALIPSMDKFSVYVSENGVAKLKPVELGVRLRGKVEIVKGLNPTDQIIVGGTQKVVEGMKVKGAGPATGDTNTPPAKVAK